MRITQESPLPLTDSRNVYGKPFFIPYCSMDDLELFPALFVHLKRCIYSKSISKPICFSL